MQGLNHTSCGFSHRGFLGFAEKSPRGPYIVGQPRAAWRAAGSADLARAARLIHCCYNLGIGLAAANSTDSTRGGALNQLDLA